MNLSKHVKVTKVSATVTAGTSAVNGTVVDMQGFEGVVFIASLGTAAADNGIKAQQGQQSNLSDAADLAGTQVLSDATQTDLVLDVYKPQERYIRPVVVRGTSTTVEAVWAIQYEARTKATTNVTAAQAAELHVSPDEGTA